MKQTIELRKLRDFGQVITDTFTFFKENFKPLMRSLFIICGVFILLGTVTSTAAYLNMSSVFNFRPGGFNTYDMEGHTRSYFISTAFNLLVLLLSQSCTYLVTLCYISVYLQNNKSQPTLAEVWGFFKYYFWRVLGSSILLLLLCMVGFVFCIIPGIYLGIVFSLVIPTIVIENASFSYAFNKSFRLIRENWWFVFGVLFVISLIVGFAAGIASVPLTLITLLGKFLTNKSITLPLIIFFSLLENLLIIARSLVAISISMCYFDLSEQKEGTGILDRIDNFGKKPDETPDLSAEEY